MFLYPLAIVLILLAIINPIFKNHTIVYRMTILFTFPFAILDFLHALPGGIKEATGLDHLSQWAGEYIPLFSFGMGWVAPALIGFVVGYIQFSRLKNKTNN